MTQPTETVAAYLSGVDLTGLSPLSALRLGQLTAELLELAEARGYRKAITALRDGRAIRRWEISVRPPNKASGWSPLLSAAPHAADYLEAIAEEGK